MTLGERLQEARGSRSLRLAAHDLGVDPMTLKSWEEGFKAPRHDKAEALATYLKVSRAEVLGLLGILSPEEVEALRMPPRKPRPKSPRRPEPATVTVPELPGAYLSAATFGPVLAQVA